MSLQTANIISTPDITGNIGSCTSNSVVVDSGYNVFARSNTTIVTNSCTGVVTTFNSWELGFFPWVVIILGIAIFWAVIASNTSKANNPY